ncbi:Spy/CpxP family protein refolding chaperone [Roseivirga sp. BDSF3-8]|uniref:Spy/CpxP family protein refolding chaperone n=1 Tax=Roseivirga sp. BDSF3-8 TaxID=3241598 RepID=UPI0035325AE6
MKKIILITLMMITAGAAYSQRGSGEYREKLEAARIAIITEKLSLSPEQAQRFWPIFNEFDDKRKGLRRNMAEARRNLQIGDLSEAEADKLLDEWKAHRMAEVKLETEYMERFREVLSARQVLALISVEDELRRRLLRRLNERRGG